MSQAQLLLYLSCALVFVILSLPATLLMIGLIPLVEVNIPDSRISTQNVPSFEGPLRENHILSGASKLFDGLLQGPESIIEHKGDLYTSGLGGSIIRIPKERNVFQIIANLSGSECETQCKSDRVKCGRTLALRFDSAGFLYALDAYSGIKKIDITTGIVTTIIDFRGKPHAGRHIIFVDDFVIDEEENGRSGPHVFYITDSSGKYEVELCHMPVMEAETSGRVLKFDAKTQKLTIIKDELSFANGIELSDDKQFLLVNELANRIVWKIHIRGPQAGTSEELMSNLPGMPDNIRRSTRRDQETYWIATYAARKAPTFYENLRNNRPFLFKVFIRLLYNIEYIWSLYGNFVPRPYCKYFAIPGRFAMTLTIEEVPGLAFEVDTKGNILRSVWDPTGRITFLSEAREVIEDGYKVLYLGSFVNPYLGRVVLEPASSEDHESGASRIGVTTSPTQEQKHEEKEGTRPGAKSSTTRAPKKKASSKTEL